MKRYDAITIFPEMFDAIADFGITQRALDAGAWELVCWNPRDFALDPHRTIDDRPYGGGPGMVMMAEPLASAIDAAKARQSRQGVTGTRVVHLTPQARPATDRTVRDLSQHDGLVFLCGRYEGVDQRLIDSHVDLEISIGDFVLSGGELAAMVLIDAMVRLLPGVLNDGSSADEDSYSPARGGLLDHPHYTRPVTWNGMSVPQVLQSGDHARIAAWRREQAVARTRERRPELLPAVARS